MTVLIVVPGQDTPWQVSGFAFRLLVDQARQLQPPADVLQQIGNGQALQALDLTAMPVTERGRVAVVLAGSARRLRRSLVDQGARDEWEAELIQALGVLEMWMEGLLDLE